jgi:hypothetical protein
MTNWFPETVYAFRRLRLLWAEFLILGVIKDDHSHGYIERAVEVADEIKAFRELYYPDPRQHEAGSQRR